MFRRKYLQIGLLSYTFLLFFVPSIFSEALNRDIELKNPIRMNGEDILNLQKRLLFIGFSEIGEADGYFGPLTEGVIKDIQAFSGFEPNGKVNETLWDYIFSEEKYDYLKAISTILAYSPKQLLREDFFGVNLLGQNVSVAIYSALDLYSPGRRVEIVEYFIWPTHEKLIGYSFNQETYPCFIEYGTFSDRQKWGIEMKEKFYMIQNNGFFEFVNGVKLPFVVDNNTNIIHYINEVLIYLDNSNRFSIYNQPKLHITGL